MATNYYINENGMAQGHLVGLIKAIVTQLGGSTTVGGYISVGDVVSLGSFASAASGSGVAISSSRTAASRIYADDGGVSVVPSGSVPDYKALLVRSLITYDQSGGDTRYHSLMGQLKSYDGEWGDEQWSAVHGYVELVRNAGTRSYQGYGVTGCLMGTLETSGTMTVDTNHVFAGVAAISKMTSGLTQTGKTCGLYVGIYDVTNWSDSTARSKWGIGVYIPAAAATEGIRVGDFASSYATGSGLAFSATNTGIVKAYGESTSDLTSAYNCRVGVFRHLIVTASATVNHETYGAIGQLCVKNTTLGHLHGGLMGTFEVSTAATVNGTYDYGIGAVIGRLGVGTSVLTCTKPISAFSAVYNGGALVSGSSVAFSSCSTTATNFTYFAAVEACDNFFYAATGTSYENAVKIGSMTSVGGVTHAASGVVRCNVAGTAYYIMLYAAGDFTGE